MKPIRLLLLFFCISTFTLNAQTLINKVWEQATGHPTIAFDHIATARQGTEVFIVGNTYHFGEQENFLITKYNTSGVMQWQKEYNSISSDRDFGMDAYIKGTHLYVTGFSWDSASNDADLVTLKLTLDSGNIVWTATYAGAYGGYDAAAGVRVDNSGNVYVAGSEQTGVMDSKMIVVKYNSSGTQQWVTAYDSTGYFDGAVALDMDPNGNRLKTIGFSGSAFSSWDFVTHSFNNSGSVTGYSRSANPNGGISKPVAFTQDYAGNLYVLGNIALSPTNNDIKLIKYDTLFNQVWVQTFGCADSLDDEATAIAVDGQGRVIISGFTSRSNGATDMLTLKYDKNGNIVWSRTISSPDLTKDATGRDVKVEMSAASTIYVAGKVYNNSNYDYLTASYTKDGDLRWVKYFDDTTGSNDVGLDLVLDNSSNIIVSGICVKDTSTRYVSVKYEQWEKNIVVAYDSINDSTQIPSLIKDELIVRFCPSKVNLDFVNNLDLEFAEIEEVISFSEISAISRIIGDSNFLKAKVEKIFKHMTASDSLSITRLGDTVKLYEHWSTLLLVFPDNTNINLIKDSLNSQDSTNAIYKVIKYAHENWLGTLDNAPNDYYYTHNYQASLKGTSSYGNAHINVEQAWDIYPECGNEGIKVGIYDHPIYWGHPDFGNGTYTGSKVKGGWDFVENIHISQITSSGYNNFGSHGTEVAGIVGSLRNNVSGIAGVAGGDIDVLGNSGCQLFSMAVTTNGNMIPLSTISNAIVEGASYNPNTGYGYGLHIQNHSWGTYAGHPGTNNTHSDIELLLDAVKSCYLNECLMVVSRGNYADGTAGNPTDYRYPACFAEDFIVCVGGTGTDGEYLDHANSGTNDWQAMYDHGVDLAAPAARDLLIAPIWIGHPDLFGEVCAFNNGAYHCVAGTSFASPLVSGVAGLLMSKHNLLQNEGYPNNLDNDDVQHLLKKYTTVISGDYAHVGTGRLNAGATMEMINKPNYWIKHFSGNSYTVKATTTGSLTWVTLLTNDFGLPPGVYLAERTTIACSYYNSLPATQEVIDYWKRNRLFWGCSSVTSISGDHWADYQFNINGNTVDLSTTTYAWCIKYDQYGNSIPDIWIPNQPSNIKTDYSVHIYDATASDIRKPDINEGSLKVYPNPASNTVWISFATESEGGATIELANMMGEIVDTTHLLDLKSGAHTYIIFTENLPSGLYFVTLKSTIINQTRKLILKK